MKTINNGLMIAAGLKTINNNNNNNVVNTISGNLEDRESSWKIIKRNLSRVVEYGKKEGILQARNIKNNIPGIVLQVQEEAHIAKENRSHKVNLPTNDISIIHEAIPFLPVPAALICLILNIFIPGSGTILSGINAFCMGQPRINFKEGRKLMTFFINLLVGISQFFTITFLFVGWFWSIAWGGLLIIHSLQYREALFQRRKETVATAAIEAFTKDSILHRRDVETLVKEQKKASNKTKK